MKHKIIYLGLLLALAACASSPQPDRTMGKWQVMVSHAGKSNMLCYAGSSPAQSAGTIAKREGAPYLMATRRPSGKIELSAYAGYDFMRGSKVELAVGDETHTLFFEKSIAWAADDAEDKAIIDAIRKVDSAERIEVRGVSASGETSIDLYSSQGFAAAIARIRELCP